MNIFLKTALLIGSKKCIQIDNSLKWFFLLLLGGITLLYDMDQCFPVCYPIFPFPYRFYTQLWNGKNKIKQRIVSNLLEIIPIYVMNERNYHIYQMHASMCMK